MLPKPQVKQGKLSRLNELLLAHVPVVCTQPHLFVSQANECFSPMFPCECTNTNPLYLPLWLDEDQPQPPQLPQALDPLWSLEHQRASPNMSSPLAPFIDPYEPSSGPMKTVRPQSSSANGPTNPGKPRPRPLPTLSRGLRPAKKKLPTATAGKTARPEPDEPAPSISDPIMAPPTYRDATAHAAHWLSDSFSDSEEPTVQ